MPSPPHRIVPLFSTAHTAALTIAKVPSCMRAAFLKLHISILLAGFTGIFGKLIQLAEGPLVWYRMLITSLLFFCWLCYAEKLPKVTPRQALAIAGVGVLVALHWVFFYGSIKYANVSIAVVCFALTGFFTAVFEPLLEQRSLSLRELCFSLITVCGIVLIFHFDTRYRTGIILGVISAAMCALFTIAIRKTGKHHTSTTMLFYQMIGGFLFISLAAPLYLALFPGISLVPSRLDLLWLFLLSSLCTIGMFLLQIQALRHISAFTVNLSYNLEPVYSIILAMIIFHEANELNASFFAGLAFICASVALQSMYAVRQRGGVK